MGSYCVIVVTETDRLSRLARKAAEKLGPRYRSIRTVRAETVRFGARIAKSRSSIHVEQRDVVGFCVPTKDKPRDIEPVVIEGGRPTPVTHLFTLKDGDYCVGTRTEIEERRAEIVARFAREIAERLFLCEAMSLAIENAAGDVELRGWSTDPKTLEFSIAGDEGGRIAKRLPKWMKPQEREEGAD